MTHGTSPPPTRHAPRRSISMGPRRPIGLQLIALLMAGTAAWAGAPESSTPPEAALRWDRYVQYRQLLLDHPDSARALATRLIAEDDGDFLGRWLAGASASAWDSSEARAMRARANATPGHPGMQVEAGTILLAAGDVSAARATLDRAVRGYSTAGRERDAAWAALWKVVKRRDQTERASLRADAAQAESLARRVADPTTLAAALLARAYVTRPADNRAALRMLQQALEETPPEAVLLRSDVHLELASCLKMDADFSAAERHYTAALEQGRADGFNEREALMGLAQCARGRGEVDTSIALLERALDVALRTRRPRGAVAATVELASLLKESGHYEQARERYHQCLHQIDSLGMEPDDKVVTLDGLGSVEALTGHYDAARERFEQALELCRVEGLDRRMPFVLLHDAELHEDLGDPEAAHALIERGLDAARKTGHRRAEILLLSERGDVLRRLDRRDEALRSVREAKRLAVEVEPRRLGAITQSEAIALVDLKRPRDAVAVLDTAIARAEARRDSMEWARLLRVRGAALHEDHALDAARAAFGQGLALAESLASPVLAAEIQVSLGATELDASRPYEAIRRLEEGLAWFERARSAVKTSEERTGFQDAYHDFYFSLARAYARTGQTHAAFATLERSRARELRQLFGSRPARALRGVPESSRRGLDRVESDLSALQSRILEQYARPPRERAHGLSRLEARADSIKSRWRELSMRLEREAPEFARHDRLATPPSLPQVQARLDRGQRLVAYMVGLGGTLVFDIRRGRAAIHELPWNESDLAERVDRFTAALRGQTDDAGWRLRSATLADTLLGALQLGLDPPRRLYVIPDAALHYVPFEALMPPSVGDRPRRTLIETSEVVYATSATLLFAPAPAARAGDADRPLVAFGDPAVGDAAPPHDSRSGARGVLPLVGPLPHARREAQDLAALFKGSRVYVGADASESRFFDELGRARILHVAAHAFIDDRHPPFSGIVLAPGTDAAHRRDGLVQAFEVLQSNADLELVTLSACETAGGRLQRGEGMLGLSRAFQLAGTRQLIVSLWKVDDAATADFMRAFYARLKQGESVAAALRGAKRGFLEGRAPDTPFVAAAGADRGVSTRSAAEFRAAPAAWAAFVLLESRSR